MDLREDPSRQSLEFPSNLTNTERKYIHLLASQIGLVSKSVGKGDQRRITISKRNEHTKKTSGEEEALPILKIGTGGIDALRKHIQRFPPSHTEEMESKETGASLIEAMQKQRQQNSTNADNDMDVVLTAALDELNKGGPRVAPTVEIQSKAVDMNRRIERHTYYQRLKQSDQDYHRIIQNRAKLPAFARRDEIIQTIATNPVTIIQGGTYHIMALPSLLSKKGGNKFLCILSLLCPYLIFQIHHRNWLR
jgi:hypothetical protein